MSARRALGMALILATPWAAMGQGASKAGPPAREALISRLAEEAGLDEQKARDARPQLEAELAMRALLERKAMAEGLDKAPKVAASLELARQNALAQAYVEKMERSLPVTDAELRSDYESAYPPKRLAKVKFAIYADPAKAASALATLAKGGASIEELAKLGDDQLVAQRAGNFGVVPFEAMPEPVAAAIEASPKRKWPAAPVKTAYGNVLYELTGVETGRERSFDQAKPDLIKKRKLMLMRVEMAKLKTEASKTP